MKVTPYTPLDLFKYTAVMTYSEKLTTLKAKEELIRKLHSSFDAGSSTNKPIEEFTLNYKAYTYLLDITYPDSTNKLPKFLTETKDSIGSDLLSALIRNKATFETMVDTFQYTNTLYFKFNDIHHLADLNLIVEENKLPANLLLFFRDNTIPLGILSSTDTYINKELQTDRIKRGGWLFDSYNASTTSATNSIVTLLVQRRLLPSNLHFTYWDGLLDELPAEHKAEAITLVNTYNEEIALSTSYINKQHKDT